jgi:hypothetical protein
MLRLRHASFSRVVTCKDTIFMILGGVLSDFDSSRNICTGFSSVWQQCKIILHSAYWTLLSDGKGIQDVQ